MVRSPKKRQPYPNPAQHKVCAAEVILLCEKLEAACVAQAITYVSMYPLNVLIFGLCASSASTPPILVDPHLKRQLPSLYIMR
ncbi:hypothetical protein BDR05DRAFT_964757 [Suillus weaverae]|nr:hypothetical protein BDR05DRAFT_964757 [Suillus weaverae]